LWWLRARFPPNNIILDGVEFRKRTVDTFVCVQNVIDVCGGYTVSSKCNL